MYIAKINTIINYTNFNAGDVVPDLYVTERLVENGVLQFVPNPKQDLKEDVKPVKPVNSAKSFKKSKKQEKQKKVEETETPVEFLTEDSSNVEITQIYEENLIK